MSDVAPTDDDDALDKRIEAVFSGWRKSVADIECLIRETKIAAKAASADNARHNKLQDAVNRLQTELREAKAQKLREAKAQEDRRRLLAKIEKVVGPVLWRSSIKDTHGFSTPKAIVDAELFRLEERCAALGRDRSRWSKQASRAIKQFADALRKANRPKLGLHEDLRGLLGINQMIYRLEAYEKVRQKPKPDAYAKRMAALSAMYLCERFGIALATTRATTRNTGEKTKASVFCRLAAVLYGDESADMQHHCREAVQKRRSAKPGQR
jgi:hypothetical protein